MPQLRRSIEIDAPVSEVFAYAATPENLPEIWPSMIEVSNVQRGADGSNSFDWVYKMAGMKFHGHSTTAEFERDRLIVTRNETGIKSTFRWTFEGRGDKTIFSQEVDYEIPGSLLGRFAAPFIHLLNEHESLIVMQNMKARLEQRAEAAAEAESRPEA